MTSQAEASAGGRLRQLIAQLSDGVLVIDRDGCLVFLNPAAEHLLGRPSADLLGEHVGLPPVAGAPAVEIELVTSDGSERVAEMRIAEVEWDGQPAFVASLRDVTEHKRLEERYRRASQTLEAIVEASPLPVVQLGPDFSVNFWNAAADELFTDSHQLSRGMPLPIARDAQNQELFRAPQRLGRGENRVRVEAVYTRGDEPLQLAVFISALRDGDGGVAGMVAIIEEITDRKRVEIEAREDPLTGLGNRRVLMAELEAAIARARSGWPGAVILIDIDGFKEVNDALGHRTGDKLLADLAHRLEAVLRPGDVLARYGGDELVVIPHRATIAEAEWIGERLRSCGDRVSLDGGSMAVSLSIGIVPIDGSLDADRALEEADRALYDAKRQGRNRVVLRRLGGS